MWEGKVLVTASNPAPGQLRQIEGDPGHQLSDLGLGVNVYVAGGAGPSGSVVTTLMNVREEPTNWLQTVQPVRLVGGNHEGTIMDTTRWQSGTTATGHVLFQGLGYATITPGTASNGEAWLMTSTKARFLTPFPNFVMNAVRLSDEGVVGSRRRWGATDNGVDNFIGFELSGTTRNFIVKCSGTFDLSFPASGTWLGNVSDDTHRYEIWWWREQAVWFVDGVQVFSFRPDGYGHAIMTTMTLFARARSVNYATIPAGSGSIELHESSISRMGPRNAQSYWYGHPGGAVARLLKKGPGTFYRVTFNGLSAASSNAIVTFYDGIDATGTVIASIDTQKISVPVTLNYELEVSNGIYCSGGANAAGFTAVFD